MAKLVIVESPAKAKTIGKYLGKDYEVTASMGHIRDLPKSQLGIDVEHDYAPQYINIKDKSKLIKELKAKAKQADGVLLATDPDREGEAISWHLANILGLDPHEPNRVTFDEITKKGVKEGMAHPRAIDEDLFNAQQARRILDRLVGYKLSPFLWRKVRRGLSAGRVQSVAVRLIDDREKEIESFKPEEEKHFNPNSLKVTLALSVATSIDALAVGISFSCIGYRVLADIWQPVTIIGLVSLVLAFAGFMIGIFAGKRFHFPVERLGGILLIGIGLKILYTHLYGG